MKFRILATVSLSLIGMGSSLGCSAKFDPASVRAKSGAPASAVVEEQRIPYDANLPRYVVAVEMPVFPSWSDVVSGESSGSLSGSGKGTLTNFGGAVSGSGSVQSKGNARWVRQYFEFNKFTQMVSSQLVSALAAVENFSVIDPMAQAPQRINPGEKGPYIVRAQVNIAESRVVTDKDKLNLLVVSNSEEVSEGLVELDIQLVEKSSGRVLSGFPVQGTFVSKQKKSGAGFIVPVYEQERSARSLIENAARVALQNAARRIFDVLRGQR